MLDTGGQPAVAYHQAKNHPCQGFLCFTTPCNVQVAAATCILFGRTQRFSQTKQTPPGVPPGERLIWYYYNVREGVSDSISVSDLSYHLFLIFMISSGRPE